METMSYKNIWIWDWFLKKRFDFYLAGHNHHLEHLRQGVNDPEYIISGAASSNYEDSENRRNSKSSSATSLFKHQSNGFIRMEISIEKAIVEYYDLSGQIIYQFEKER